MTRRNCSLVSTLAALLVLGCSSAPSKPTAKKDVDLLATRYVELVLAVDRHKEGYVDYYVGPEELKEAAAAGEPVELEVLAQRAVALLKEVRALASSARSRFLVSQMRSVVANLRILRGEKLDFDEWALEMYGYQIDRNAEQQIRAAQEVLLDVFPGEEETLGDRVRAYRGQFALDRAGIERVTQHCLNVGRERTRRAKVLPEGEEASIAYVRDKPFPAYAFYLGKNKTRIEVNVDLPSSGAFLCFAALHEGYPGHHVYSTLLDQLAQNGIIELSVYPLASPMSFLFEGSANAALEILFPGEKWNEFIRDEVAPLAGVPDEERARYARVEGAILKHIQHDGIDIAYKMFKEKRPSKELMAQVLAGGAPIPIADWFLGEFVPSQGPQLGCYSTGMDRVLEAVGSSPGRERRFFDLLSKQLTPDDLTMRR